MTAPVVSIVIPHYQTELLARLCLRSIRRFTPEPACEVIVVDNNSKDGDSLRYLRSVEWIRLIERTEGLAEGVGAVHKEALDIGIDAARGRYVLSFHTDTIVLRDDWLAWLVEQIEKSDDIGAVGSYKMHTRTRARRAVQSIETLGRRLLGRSVMDTTPFIRSHCALYRRDLLLKLGHRFAEARPTTGWKIHFDLIDHGYQAVLLDVDEMNARLTHLDHGTMVLLPELGTRGRTVRKGRERIDAFINAPRIRAVLEDEGLDG